jgi:hypothetical protein
VIDINKLTNKYYYYVAYSVDDKIIKYFEIFMCIFILREMFKFVLFILELIVITTPIDCKVKSV